MSPNFKKTVLSAVAVVGLLVILLSGSAGPVFAATQFVNPALGADTAGCGSAPGASACKTIQYTINLASVASGDTINLAAGTYVENVAVNKVVTILGAGQGSSIIEPAVSDPNCGGAGGGTLCAPNNTVILVQAVGVTIQGLTVEGGNPLLPGGVTVHGAKVDARNGIVTDFNSGNFNNLTVQNVTVQNVYFRALYGTAQSGNISGIMFQNDTVTNVQGDTVGGNSVGIIIRSGSGQILNNIVNGGPDGTGIDLNFSSGSTISGNTVTNSGEPIAAANTNLGTTDTISGNMVSNSPIGIESFATYGTVNITGNMVTNNTVGIRISGQSDPSEQVTVSNNIITANGTAASTGILVLAGYIYPATLNPTNVAATITNNRVTNAGVGLQVDGGGFSTQAVTLNATANVIQSNVTDGVLLNGFKSFSGSFRQNCISGNGAGMTNSQAGVTIDAASNWWGSATGPGPVGSGSGDKVSISVTFNPFLTTIPAGCPPVTLSTAGAPAAFPATCGLFGYQPSDKVRMYGSGSATTTGGVPVTICYAILTDPVQVGVTDRAFTLAVDVLAFRQTDIQSVASLIQPVQVCLQGAGSLLFRDATGAPRQTTTLSATSNTGFTCGLIPNAGTLILIPGAAAPAGSVGASGASVPSHSLSICTITTLYGLNMHSAPDIASKVVGFGIPQGVLLSATARAGDWIEVTYGSTQGWLLIPNDLTLNGVCS